MMGVPKGCYCSAINCSTNKGENPDLSFFRFPKEPERSKRWVINCRREDFLHKDVGYLRRNCHICSKHFENGEFMNCNKNSLIKIAVPTLFEINIPQKTVILTLKRKASHHSDKMQQSKRTKLNRTEREVSVKPEAVWLPEDEAVLADMKTEPVTDSEAMMQEINSTEEIEEAPLSPECSDDMNKEIKTEIDIEEDSIVEEESLESHCGAGEMGSEIVVKPEPVGLLEDDDLNHVQVKDEAPSSP